MTSGAGNRDNVPISLEPGIHRPQNIIGIENIHILIRDICPKETDLYALGLDSQEKANRISSHINSYSRKKLNNKTSFSVLKFFNKEMADKLIDQGLTEIPPDQVILKPYLLK